ncbi:integral membrane protein [Streptomyces zinciresistens K42]|uniref:Integral membrane protein n=1 Tax=Streptomyces zinciresistens K42 TaxID=700597 RepID=G2GAK4_9ACTN|nr:hypothetical protein [Streptomyces zinciresistens]EGX59451.1 integral membrane protein [Streptomyces zinciresistens K42]
MTDQPYQGYDGHDRYDGHDGYDPYRRPAPQEWPAQQQGHGEQQGYGDPQGYEDPRAAQQYTQQWQGQTWETQVQPPVAPAADETAYLPPQGHDPYGSAAGYGADGWNGSGQYPHAPHGRVPQGGQPPYTPFPGGQPAPGSFRGGQPQPPHAPVQGGQPSPFPGGQPAPSPFPGGQPQPGPAAGHGPGEADGPGYGPATLAGNTRVTDAQRARQEGRSPIIEPGIQPAALTALLGLLLAAGAAIGSYGLLVPLVALQAVTAAGWFRLNGMWPARQGIALAFAGGLTADVALLVSGRSPAAIVGTLGVWVLLTLVLQLRSHADPDERMYGLMATVASAALTIIASGYLAAGADAVSVAGVAVGLAVLVRAAPLPAPASAVAALLAGAGAGAVVGLMTDIGAGGALLGAGAAVTALAGHRAASYDYPSRFVHFTAGVALPLAATAPVAYLLGRALG